MKFDQNTIEEKIKSLPDEIQVAMIAPEIPEKIQDIANKYSLNIEQTGIIMDITSYVMIGLVPSKNFASELSKEIQINPEEANNIAKDINDEIFLGIKESLKKIEDQREKENSADADLAHAGGINVEKSGASEDVLSASRPTPTTNANAQLSAAITLDAIENPPAFVDRLLTGTSTSINETVVKTAIDIPVKPTSSQTIVPPKPPTPSAPKIDPYREPIQ